jgi:hypothetical protein
LIHRSTTWLPASLLVMVTLLRAGGAPTDSISRPASETLRPKIAFVVPRRVIVDAVSDGSW